MIDEKIIPLQSENDSVNYQKSFFIDDKTALSMDYLSQDLY